MKRRQRFTKADYYELDWYYEECTDGKMQRVMMRVWLQEVGTKKEVVCPQVPPARSQEDMMQLSRRFWEDVAHHLSSVENTHACCVYC